MSGCAVEARVEVGPAGEDQAVKGREDPYETPWRRGEQDGAAVGARNGPYIAIGNQRCRLVPAPKRTVST